MDPFRAEIDAMCDTCSQKVVTRIQQLTAFTGVMDLVSTLGLAWIRGATPKSLLEVLEQALDHVKDKQLLEADRRRLETENALDEAFYAEQARVRSTQALKKLNCKGVALRFPACKDCAHSIRYTKCVWPCDFGYPRCTYGDRCHRLHFPPNYHDALAIVSIGPNKSLVTVKLDGTIRGSRFSCCIVDSQVDLASIFLNYVKTDQCTFVDWIEAGYPLTLYKSTVTCFIEPPGGSAQPQLQ